MTESRTRDLKGLLPKDTVESSQDLLSVKRKPETIDQMSPVVSEQSSTCDKSSPISQRTSTETTIPSEQCSNKDPKETDEDDAFETPSSSDCEEWLGMARLRKGYNPLRRMQRLRGKGAEALIDGHYQDQEVIRIVTGVERLLLNAKEKTPDEPKIQVDTGGDDEETAKIPANDSNKPAAAEAKTEVGPTGDEGEKADLSTDGHSIKYLGEPKLKKYRYQEFFEIRRSTVGGLGAFAEKELKMGDVILVEKPILKNTVLNIIRDFQKLDEETKKIYLSLHPVEDPDTNLIDRIRRANAFQVPNGIAIFATAARFNHGCGDKRNIKYVYDERCNVMTFTVCHDVIPAGAELLVTYGGSPVNLFRTFGFRCKCGGCGGLSDEEARRIQDEEFGCPVW